MEQTESQKSYSPISTVLFTVSIYILSQIFASIFILIIPVIRGWSLDQSLRWVDGNVWGTFGYVLLVESITLSLLYLLQRRIRNTFYELGLNRPVLKYIGYSIIGFIAYFVMYIIVVIITSALIPSLDLQKKQEIGFDTATQGIELLPVFLSLVILPPIVEEIVARGFLFGGLRKKMPFIASAAITSVLFAAAHIGGASEGLLWVAAIDTLILSMILCVLREKTGSLWPPIAVHMIKNGLAFVIIFNIFQYLR